MVAFHQNGEHQSGVIGPRGLPKAAVGTFEPFIYVRVEPTGLGVAAA